MISSYLYTAGFKELEQNYAIESNQRAFRAILAQLKYNYLLNLDYAYWTDTHQFMHDNNKHFMDENLTVDLFNDNKIDVVILLSENKKLVWGKSYNLYKKQLSTIPPYLLSFLQRQLPQILINKNIINKEI